MILVVVIYLIGNTSTKILGILETPLIVVLCYLWFGFRAQKGLA